MDVYITKCTVRSVTCDDAMLTATSEGTYVCVYPHGKTDERANERKSRLLRGTRGDKVDTDKNEEAGWRVRGAGAAGAISMPDVWEGSLITLRSGLMGRRVRGYMREERYSGREWTVDRTAAARSRSTKDERG